MRVARAVGPTPRVPPEPAVVIRLTCACGRKLQIKDEFAGRQGAFALYHIGTMDRGKPQLSVRVVPDSGTGQLTGLTGTMTIDIDAGNHSYGFDYSLPELDE